MILSVARYRAITGDDDTPGTKVTQALVDAQRLVEDELRRPLERATVTERLPIYGTPGFWGHGTVHPRRIPLVSVPAGSSYRILTTATATDASVDAGLFTLGDLNTPDTRTATVTFTGGWLPADDPLAGTDPYVIPVRLERAIAAIAQGLSTPVAAQPAGLLSASVDGVAVTFADATGDPQLSDPITALLEQYSYRPY